MKKNKLKFLLIIAIVVTLIAGFSGTYAFFIYRKTGENIALTSGKISIEFANDTNYLSVSDAYPLSEAKGKIYPYYTDFTIDGLIEDYPIKYEIQIVPDSSNTIDASYIKVYLTNTSEEEIVPATLYSDLVDASYNTTGKIIYADTMSTSSSITFRLRVWIDDSYTRNVQEDFGFNVYLYAVNDDNV